MTNQQKIDRLKEIEAQCIEWDIWSVELAQAFDDAIKSLQESPNAEQQ